jgi:hypothetical protein
MYLNTIILTASVHLLSSYASIDRGLTNASDAMSSRGSVTVTREFNPCSESEGIRNAEILCKREIGRYSQQGKSVNTQSQNFSGAQSVSDKLQQVTHRKYLPRRLDLVDNDPLMPMPMVAGRYSYTPGDFGVKPQLDPMMCL